MVRRMTLTSLLIAICIALAPGPGSAQVDESRALREAAALESVGDFQGAEAALRLVLEEAPTSTGALFALERVLSRPRKRGFGGDRGGGGAPSREPHSSDPLTRSGSPRWRGLVVVRFDPSDLQYDSVGGDGPPNRMRRVPPAACGRSPRPGRWGKGRPRGPRRPEDKGLSLSSHPPVLELQEAGTGADLETLILLDHGGPLV